MLHQIKVKNFLNSPMAVSTERADQIFKECEKIIQNNHKIELDFEGVKLVITAFLNVAIGKLYGLDEKSQEIVDSSIEFTNTSPTVKNMIDKVIINSKKFYQNREVGLKNNNYIKKSIDGDI